MRAAPEGEAQVRLSDAMVRVAAGDRTAFAELFRQTSPKLFGLCLRIMSTRQEAEDVLQETYLTIWRRAGSYDPARGHVLPWMMVVARHCAIDRLRAGRPHAGEPIDLAETVPDPARPALDRMLEQEERQRLFDCLAELAPQDVRFIRTAFLEGSSYAELAIRAGLPLGTVKSRIRRALLKLRDCL